MQHVVSQLIEKKKELEGELNHCKSRITVLNEILHSVNTSIKLFEPECDLKTIKAKKYSPNKRYFGNGEAFRMILDFLREKDDFICTNEITIYLMGTKKYDTSDKLLKNKIQQSILQTLTSQHEKGLLKKKYISDRSILWNIA